MIHCWIPFDTKDIENIYVMTRDTFFCFDNAPGWAALIKTLHLLASFHIHHGKVCEVELLVKRFDVPLRKI